ncbi:hypothetical protein [Photobacterium damselae]|uniref:hypothetical protein n=1 Tax=Photobacterium damselae TaxID=38293 RepID=UPI000D6685C2|nr:hypothetical protein [Photobacterium damselae]AWK84129.1 hypothetical protein BST98_19320 [Photobacterium damselae]
MNKKIVIALILSLVPITSFAGSRGGIAQDICVAKSGTYIQYQPESINIDLIKGHDSKVMHFMHIKDPSPVISGIVSLDGDNINYKNIIISAVNNKMSLSLCLNADGDIFSASING